MQNSNRWSFIQKKKLTSHNVQQLHQLWNTEYPLVLTKSLSEFEHYLNDLKEVTHILVVDQAQLIIGWFFSFNRSTERQFGLLISKHFHGNGIGSELIRIAQQKYISLNGWVVDQSIYHKADKTLYRSPLPFYIKNKFLKTKERWDSEKIKTIKVHWKSDFKNF